MPEWDVESSGVIGWGLEAARKFFHRRRRHRPPKWVFENCQILCFLTHFRDLDAMLPESCS